MSGARPGFVAQDGPGSWRLEVWAQPGGSMDAVAGTLDVLVDEATWDARPPAPYNAPSQTGFGRELFANFRRHAGGAEQGACTWL